MPHAKGVVFAFRPVGEGAHAIFGADGGHAVFTACEYLVGVGLVADVPDNLVGGGVEDVVQGDGQLDSAQACRKVATRNADGLDQILPQIICKFS